MANRYRHTRIKQNTDTNVQHMESTIYPRVRATDDDIYAITEAGDRLDLLAKRFYGDPAYWWIIATANNMNDANFYVEPGIQIRIPGDLNAILNQLERVNK